ncbi:hypothetical protein ABZ725_23685 [Streptomyces sp. NPDC006872]|uniref:RICIN domain-containing protein n=1 Tax=Streptomyces sp. NPDC006872 TaxID=3155720 RepID=UPI0033E85DF6
MPVQDTCTGAADRSWTLAASTGGAIRTLRNAHSGRCLAVAGAENFSPARRPAGPPARLHRPARRAALGAAVGDR